MSAHAFVRSGILLSVCALAFPSIAAAEVVAIKHGTFVYDNNTNTLDISGTQGFRLTAGIIGPDGHFNAFEFCRFSEECTPGAVIPIAAGWGGSAVPGTARVRGATYTDLGSASSPNGVLVEFDGSITMPEITGGAAAVTVPFEFGGRFSFVDEQSSSGHAGILTGGGFATFFMVPGVGGSWVIERVEFTFRPARR
jgi:hypothetical protein